MIWATRVGLLRPVTQLKALLSLTGWYEGHGIRVWEVLRACQYQRQIHSSLYPCQYLSRTTGAPQNPALHPITPAFIRGLALVTEVNGRGEWILFYCFTRQTKSQPLACTATPVALLKPAVACTAVPVDG